MLANEGLGELSDPLVFHPTDVFVESSWRLLKAACLIGSALALTKIWIHVVSHFYDDHFPDDRGRET